MYQMGNKQGAVVLFSEHHGTDLMHLYNDMGSHQSGAIRDGYHLNTPRFCSGRYNGSASSRSIVCWKIS